MPQEQETELNVDGGGIIDFIKNDVLGAGVKNIVSIGKGAVDVAKGVIAGPTKFAEDMAQTTHDIVNIADNKLAGGRLIDDTTKYDLVPEFWKPKTGAGEVAMHLSAFTVGWLTLGNTVKEGMKGLKGIQWIASKTPKIATITQAAVANGTVAGVVNDPEAARIADLLVECPALNNRLTRYLAASEDDTPAEARFKNLIEDMMFSAGVEAAAMTYKTFRGMKAVHQGKPQNIGIALADRKRIAREIEEEQTRKYLAERGKAVGTTFSPQLTQEAKVQGVREELKKNPKGTLEKVRDITGHPGKDVGLNAEKFDQAETFVKKLNEGVKEITRNDHMDMKVEAAKALDTCLAAGGDQIIDVDLLRQATLNKTDIEKIATFNVYLEYFIGPQYEAALKNLASGAEGSDAYLRKVLSDGYEIMVDLKKLGYRYGQGVKANDINRFVPEIIAQGAGLEGAARTIKTPITKLIPDSAKYAKETVAGMSTEHLENLARAISITYKNGGDVVELFIKGLTVDNVLKQAYTDKNTMFDTALGLRYTAMLSSLGTQFANAIGTGIKTIMVSIEEPMKASIKGGLDSMYAGGVEGGVPGMVYHGGVGALRGLKEGVAYNKGLVVSAPTALSNIAPAWKHMHSMSRPGETARIGSALMEKAPTGGIVKKGYNAARDNVFRMMHITDEVLSAWSGMAKVYERSTQDLRSSGILDGITDSEQIKKVTKIWHKDYAQKSYAEVVLKDGTTAKRFAIQEAVDVATDVGLKRELGSLAEKFMNFVNTTPVMRLIFPFTRTPLNLASDTFVRRGPLKIFELPSIRQAWESGDNVKKAEILTHVTTGAALWGSAYGLVKSGLVTGRAPSNVVAKDAQYANKIPPYSVKVGDTYISLQRLEPFGSAVMVLADFAQIAGEEGISDPMELGEAYFKALGGFMVNQSYFTGLANVVNDLQRGNGGNGFISDTALSFIAPGIVSELARSADPAIYDARTFLDKLYRKWGTTYSLAPSVNWITGQPKTQMYGGGMGTYNPLRPSQSKDDNVFEELMKIQGVGNPQRRIGTRELSSHEYANFCKLHGTIKLNNKTLYEALNAIVLSDGYDVDRRRTSDPAPNTLLKARNDVLVKTIEHYRRATEDEWKRRNPYYRQEPTEIRTPNYGTIISY